MDATRTAELFTQLRILANAWREVSETVNANGHLMVAADQLEGVVRNYENVNAPYCEKCSAFHFKDEPCG